MILRLLIFALSASVTWGAGQWLNARHWRAEALSAQQSASAQRLRADGCAARIDTITDDKESDHAVDQMDLRAVPDRWMRAAAP